MKGLGIALVGLLAIAGGIVAATYITKKKLEKENEEDYYDDWDDASWDDDDFDFDFEEDVDISAKGADIPKEVPVEIKRSGDLIEDEDDDDSSEDL